MGAAIGPWVDVLGYTAAALTVATYSMKTMVRLRVVGIGANLFFILYGALASVYPALVLHAILLPLNIVRLRQMLALVAEVRAAARGDLALDWLRPFTHKKRFAAGESLWRRGDEADEMLFVLSGRFRVLEPGLDAGPGDVVGELAMIVPGQRRTQSVVCLEAGEALAIGFDEVRQLYFQNPKFGFFFLQLASRRLLQDAQAPGTHARADTPPSASTAVVS
jgi:CRP-like cAMP-binding protein